MAILEPQTLTPCSSGRRSSASNSPEFEFWMVRNPSCSLQNQLSADELFVDGVLLPLQLLNLHHNCEAPEQTPAPELEPEPPNSEQASAEPVPESEQGPRPSVAIMETTSSCSSSKRWKDIFKMSEKKSSVNIKSSAEGRDREKEGKQKKKERKSGKGGSSTTELNINIWPFSRSRSAGNAGNRSTVFAGALGIRKVNSAPCSRSNSAGESKSRKWPGSPCRSGVQLGRSSPVWQVRRSGSGNKNNSHPRPKNAEKIFKNKTPEIRQNKIAAKSGSGIGGIDNGKAKVLNLNVPSCIGNKQKLSRRKDKSGTLAGSGGAGSHGDSGGCVGSGGGGDVGNSGNLFNQRNLFTKKSALAASH